MGLIASLAAWLVGCRSESTKKVAEPVPDKPGTSIALTYPIVALETEPDNLHYFATEEDFTTTRKNASFWPSGSTILDGTGGVFSAEKTFQVTDAPNPMLDMGRTPYRIFIRLERRKPVDIQGARQLIIGVIRGRRSYWSESTARRDKAIEYIERYRTVPELIAGCEEYFRWR